MVGGCGSILVEDGDLLAHVTAAAKKVNREREEILIGVKNGRHILNLYTIPYLSFHEHYTRT